MKPKCCKDKRSIAKLLQAVEFLRVISDENRLKILCLLRDKEKCVCDIWQYFELPQNLTSHHLKVLKNFNLVESRKEGLKVFYSINNKAINKYLKLLNKFILPKED
jgi:ArsR family transcriptional regulator